MMSAGFEDHDVVKEPTGSRTSLNHRLSIKVLLVDNS